MIALLLVISLFLYLTWIGQAVISLLRLRLGVVWSWFMAPTVGLALIVTIITRLSVWGWPVKTFGPWLTVGLLVGATAILAWRRPKLPWRQLAPFFIIAVGNLFYTGWPLLRFGFNWISYGNDDMANYALTADRFLNHGYYEFPHLADLSGRDLTQSYWYFDALAQIRSGSDLLIAWVASITGLNVHQVFMPTILMLGLLQLFALGALAIFFGRHRRWTLIAFFLLATSPLFGLGIFYQLIAQVGGVALLLATASALISTKSLSARKALLAGLLACGMGIVYPEVSPFLVLAILLFAVRVVSTDRVRLPRYALFVAGTAIITFVLLGPNTIEFLSTLLDQSSRQLGQTTASLKNQEIGILLFPWTMVPSFVPTIFGLHTYGTVGTDPVLSIEIAAGFILLSYTLWRIARSTMLNAPAGYLGAVMAPLGFMLFFKEVNFGLFKLAMFIQPVVALALAQDMTRLLSQARRSIRLVAGFVFIVFFISTIPAFIHYGQGSAGGAGGDLAHAVNGSQLGVAFHPPKNLHYEAIESDLIDLVNAKMLALYTKGIETRFISRDFMRPIIGSGSRLFGSQFFHIIINQRDATARITVQPSFLGFLLPSEFLTTNVPDYRFPLLSAAGNTWTDTALRPGEHNARLFVTLRTGIEDFNNSNPGDGWITQNLYKYKLENQLHNRLVFIHSTLGQHYHIADYYNNIAIYQSEPEPITGNTTYFHGTGRVSLFRVINPSSLLRVIVDFTRSPLGASNNQLPEKAAIIGAENYPIPFVGNGSARVVSPPIKPELLQHEAYLTLDFGEDTQPIPTPKTGLMRLYGNGVNLDYRRMVGYTRDVSVLTEEQYLALPRPTKISQFPQDLFHYSGLEYSGLSEDGWIAGDAYCKLGPSHPGQLLSFRGLIPAAPKFLGQGVDLTISINGKSSSTTHLMPGEFALDCPINETSAITSVAFHFSDAQVCDAKTDQRLVSALVHEIAINDSPNPAVVFPLSSLSNEKLSHDGIDEDGWIGRIAILRTPAFPDFKVLKVDLEMPGWSSLPSNEVKAFLNDRLMQTIVMPRGTDQSLYLPLVAGVPTEVRLESAAAFALPNEKRERCFLVKAVSFESPTQADLFAHGWHKSGYAFSIDRADPDGWVDRRVAFRFPPTTQFKTAIVGIVGFPAKAGLPLAVSINGAAPVTHTLGLEQSEPLRIPLSATADTTATLTAERSFPLAAPDTRERSFRIVNIDFE
jgi:hypothetical protein